VYFSMIYMHFDVPECVHTRKLNTIANISMISRYWSFVKRGHHFTKVNPPAGAQTGARVQAHPRARTWAHLRACARARAWARVWKRGRRCSCGHEHGRACARWRSLLRFSCARVCAGERARVFWIIVGLPLGHVGTMFGPCLEHI
jgi:hypothetical protein